MCDRWIGSPPPVRTIDTRSEASVGPDHRPANPTSWLRCDVRDLVVPDLATIDRIATLALACRRTGRRVLLVGATEELRQLVMLAGLERVVAFADG